jgi:hypothetical protein
VVNSFISSDIHPTTLSRSSSVSFDNPSIDGSSLNDENPRPITTDSPSLLPTTALGRSSSLSELDPMLNGRPRTPSPIPSTLVDEQFMTIPVEDKPILTEIIDEQPPIIEEQVPIIENQPLINAEDSIDISEKTEPSAVSSPSVSIDHSLSELSVERKNDDLLQITQEDSLDLP